MVLAFIVATVVAIFFVILWSEERDKREQAELKIKQLTRENKKLKSQSPSSIKDTKKAKVPELVHKKGPRLAEKTIIANDLFAEILIHEGDDRQDNDNTTIIRKNTLTREHRTSIQVSEVTIEQTKRDDKKNNAESLPQLTKEMKKSQTIALSLPDTQEESPFLNQIKLDVLMQQTREAQDLLAEIFNQEDDSSKDTVQVNNDGALIEVLEKLFTKEQWSRIELADIVGPNIMLGNLLEQLNDYAYSKVGDIVVEEESDTIYVMTEYKEQLI